MTKQPSSRAAKVKANLEKSIGAKAEPELFTLAQNAGNFLDREFTESDEIACGLQRGEVGGLNAKPNVGKTTVCLILALCLCIGRIFRPICNSQTRRKVLFVDGETRSRRLQSDILLLIQNFTEEEKQWVRENLSIVCEAEIDEQNLCLTNNDHLIKFSQQVNLLKPDLIILDTFASLSSLYSENDNAEMQRRFLTPISKLARQSDAAILFTHHIGKQKSEEGQTSDKMYTGRGASASGGSARAIWNLTSDPITDGLVTLSCGKIKGKKPDDVRLQLDDSRWFHPIEIVKVKTTYQHLLEIVTEPMSRKEINSAMAGITSVRSITSLLDQAIQKGHLVKVGKGQYSPSVAGLAGTANE